MTVAGRSVHAAVTEKSISRYQVNHWNILFPNDAGRLLASWLASVQANALLIIPPEVKSRRPGSEVEARILENLVVQETLLVFHCVTLHAMLVFIHIITQEVVWYFNP
jgi:hypothetical protein